MAIRDRNLAHKRNIYRIGYRDFVHQVIGPTTAGEFASASSQSPTNAEISTFGYAGIEIHIQGAAFITQDMNFMQQMNPEHDIGVRILWTTNGAVATTDTVLWRVRHKQSDIGESLSQSAVALDTVIAAANPSTTTLLLRRTSRGVINANTFDWTARQAPIVWVLDVTTLGGFSANEVVFLALELDYIPKILVDPNEAADAFGVDLGEVD